MKNTAFAIPLAYPDTVVKVSDEWYVKRLHYLGIGKRNFVKAGHAAIVIIEKETGVIEYFDFGRYITPEPFGRVRSAFTDNELVIPFKAIIENNVILNKDEILQFFASNSQLTHGNGRMIASVCNCVNYEKAKTYIATFQAKKLVTYAAFKKRASNCARFVTDTLLSSIEDRRFAKNLKHLKLFTPSPVGNVLAVKGKGKVYQVFNNTISEFKNSKQKEILKCFLDPINTHEYNLEGNLKPVKIDGLSRNAQWLSGIGSGAWFELFETNKKHHYHFKRTSAFGTADVSSVFVCNQSAFDITKDYNFSYETHCNELKIIQNNEVFTFKRQASLKHEVHLA